ncbi:MAG: radical SAM protein [Bacteroidetes bacterium]|nr:radical SAM protein [Bacteroidota bacterium]
MPIKLDIENVSRCNLSCEMCQVSTWKSSKRGADMTFEDFKHILDEQYGVFELKIQGVGEPFLGKDFIRMVEYAADKDIWVRTSSNATLFHKDENYKRIIDAGVDEIQISIDGTTKKTYEKIRVNANFETVAGNCKLINKYCENLGIDKTRMWALLQEENIHELYQFLPFAKELGFKRVAFIMDVHGWGIGGFVEANSKRKIGLLKLKDDVETLLENAESLGITLGFWDIGDKYSNSNPCFWPFSRAFISSDKKVVPCCMIANPDTFNFGSLEDGFEAIWYSQRYVEFREAHLNGGIPDVCRFCYR